MEQSITASPEEAGILAGRMQEHNAAILAVQEAERALKDCFFLFSKAHSLAPTSKLLGVRGSDVVIAVPETKPELVKEA